MGLLSTIGSASGRAFGFTRTAVAAAVDAYFNLTTLLLNTSSTNGAQNNAFLDSSGNGNHPTRNGNVTQGTFTPFSQTGWSNYLDGTDDHLLTPSTTAFDLGSGDFCIEMWFYWAGSGNGYFGLFGSETDLKIAASLYNQKIMYAASSNGTAWGILQAESSLGSTTITPNTWTHFVFCRTGTTISGFVNGVRDITVTSSASIVSRTEGYVVGSWTSTAYRFLGYISNFRFVVGSNPYNAASTTLTVPTTPLTAVTNTKLLTCQSNRFLDNRTSAFALTVTGNPSVQAFSPFAPTAAYDAAVVGGSGYFDGTTDYLSFVDSANDLDLGGKVASFEAWVYPTTAAAYQHFLVKTGGAVSWSTTSGLEYAIAFDVNKFYFVYNVSASATFINGAATRKPNQWYHVVVATDASNNIALFVNGVRDGTATNAISKPTNRTLMYIGANSGGTETLTGYVSGQRFIAGTGAYDPTQTTITIPTAPPTAVTNTALLLNYTNSGIFDSTAKNDLHTVADSQVSTTQAKWGTTSIKLDGTGDWLVVRNGPHLQFGSGNFTIELWAYFSEQNRQQTVISKNDSGVWGQWYIYLSTGNALNFGASSANTSADVVNTSFGTPNFNAWNHIAVVRNGTSFTGYLNGVGTLMATSSLSLYNDPYDLRVGANVASTGLTAEAGTQFNGYMDDIRITKGYARYTANFTPPIAPFPTQ